MDIKKYLNQKVQISEHGGGLRRSISFEKVDEKEKWPPWPTT
jgi:hypothetical protein